jgi:hypothetical protein
MNTSPTDNSATLNIAPDRFIEAYNLDISEFIERHTFKETAQKGGKEINYMSYSHAYRLFRQHFPELEVALVENPATGGYIWKEIDDRGYFLKAYVYQKSPNHPCAKSSEYYYPVLSVSGQSVYPEELETQKNYKTGETTTKEGRFVANIQLFNKSNQRAIVKAIALTTGIGLKLWTRDDLAEDTLDPKQELLDRVRAIASEYTSKTGIPYLVRSTYVDTTASITTEGKTIAALIKEATITAKTEPLVEEAPVVSEVPSEPKKKKTDKIEQVKVTQEESK